MWEVRCFSEIIKDRVEVLIPWRVTSTVTSLSPFTPVAFSKMTFSKRHFSSVVGPRDLCLTETGFSLLGVASANAKSLFFLKAALHLTFLLSYCGGLDVKLAAFFLHL